MRKLLYKSKAKIIVIGHDELQDFCASLSRITKTMASIVNLIRRNGDGEVYKADIERILALSEDAKGLIVEQLNQSYAQYDKIYREMLKKVEKEYREG